MNSDFRSQTITKPVKQMLFIAMGTKVSRWAESLTEVSIQLRSGGYKGHIWPILKSPSHLSEAIRTILSGSKTAEGALATATMLDVKGAVHNFALSA